MVVEREVVILNKQGLHARPIAMLAEIASGFDASLVVGVEGREVDGRSVLQLMTLCASVGTTMTLRGDGEDAEQLVAAVTDLIQRGFDEA